MVFVATWKKPLKIEENSWICKIVFYVERAIEGQCWKPQKYFLLKVLTAKKTKPISHPT
jgi:hypothetical protein